MGNETSIKQWLMLLPLALLLTACSSSPTTLPVDSQPVKPAAIPVLPPQARQLPTPQWCLPTCSSALTRERATWLQLPTKPEPGD
ncbi:hypothetical protein D3C76_292750 [compost metagenome]|nr:hypothetical protein PS843_03683 [Pseudomonas fluorescens]